MSSTTYPAPPLAAYRRRWISRGWPAVRLRTASGRDAFPGKLTVGLGLLWLLDAALQFQPYMFTSNFPNEVIKPVGAGSPGFVSAPSHWAATLMADHIVLCNSLFALTQLAIAVGLLFRRTTKMALAGSIAWAVGVWWLGEGLGGVLAGPVSPLAGLPGAVILYVLVALLVWPRAGEPESVRTPVAFASPLRRRGASSVWLLLWGSFAFEALRPGNRSPSGLDATIRGSQDGEPAWIKAVPRSAGVLAHHGTEVSFVLGATFVAIAVSVVIPRMARLGVLLAIVVALLIWAYGEAFGELATGQATDPNTGPVLVLLALCFWPRTRPHTQTRSPRRHSRAPSSRLISLR